MGNINGRCGKQLISLYKIKLAIIHTTLLTANWAKLGHVASLSYREIRN